jgi:glucan phosphoethanolaminetransferase (alkaline phosphatase superfamily)
MKKEHQHAVLALAAEFAFWLLPPATFLFIYVRLYHHSLASATSHLALVACLALVFLSLKTVAYRQFGPRRPLLLVSSLLYALVWFCMLGYYGVVMAVLPVWGRVVTAELLTMYAGDPEFLPLVLGLSRTAAAGLALFGYALLLAWALWWQGALRWQPPLPRRPRAGVNVLLLALALFGAWNLYQRLDSPSDAQEPLALTLYSGKPHAAIRSFSQGLKVPPQAQALDVQSRRNYRAHPNAGGANVVLIVVDDLRLDHMGISGYGRDTTPYLSALVRRGGVALESQARSICSESVCAMAALESSRYSHQIPDRPFTLPQVLQQNGYRVRVMMSGVQSYGYQWPDLFGAADFIDGSQANGHASDDRFVVERTRNLPAWDGRPTMLQFHLMSTHLMGKKLGQYQRFNPDSTYIGKVKGLAEPRYTNHYDNGVLQADAMIEQLMTMLAAKGYLDAAMVVISSDHGEALGEHGLYSHTNSVYEEALRIPLMFIRFEHHMMVGAQAHERFVSLIDVAPTILQQLQLPIPSSWTGIPIQLSKRRDFTFFQMLPFVGVYDHRDARHLWKYWVNQWTKEEFAFDLSADPNELDNRALAVPVALKQAWRDQIATVPTP